ncbi:pyridoxamine 5'-phosphate oxidase family protein [Salinisphaera sp.]|uniref:pyridoxamine 5'-phosphate oxidase family protein n=1 Tax=Salinisphaera sp. TaxID=1914330 RepID=UPI000C5DDF3A|nr:pyridoxamine 5'-phosphate oxidase family protein [Salinisphaera sp.]MAS11266.1 pyridoxamine 5'-phosphate oxidase [Salinisphaera sp.]|tara:strand:- start:61 stop:549 length:489 start_codon:yes stop_codon:yes gene_type:complete
MSSPEHKQKIWNLIKKIQVGMLVTQDGNVPRARPMHLVQDEYDGTIWFYTRRSTEKVLEAQQGDSEVCLTFSDQEAGVYVSMSGKARITDDQAIIDKYWNPGVAAWLPEKEDPDVVMLEIDIEMGEHWAAKESKVFQLYEMAKANIKSDKTPNIGENEKFGG